MIVTAANMTKNSSNPGENSGTVELDELAELDELDELDEVGSGGMYEPEPGTKISWNGELPTSAILML